MYFFCVNYSTATGDDDMFLFAKNERSALKRFLKFLPDFEECNIFPLTIHSITIIDTV